MYIVNPLLADAPIIIPIPNGAALITAFCVNVIPTFLNISFTACRKKLSKYGYSHSLQAKDLHFIPFMNWLFERFSKILYFSLLLYNVIYLT
jgi:hypothetical protein